MPRIRKLPRYALFDFDDGTVEPGSSGLIDDSVEDLSEQSFNYNVSHFVYWPQRPSKNATEEEVLKQKQCAKILMFSNDLHQLKLYRDQLTDEILTVDAFQKIRQKMWEKGDPSAAEEPKPNNIGGGERQSRRLKEKQVLLKDESQSKDQTLKPLQPVKKPTAKDKQMFDLLNSENTLNKIAEQKVTIETALSNTNQLTDDNSAQDEVQQCDQHLLIDANGNIDEVPRHSRKRVHSKGSSTVASAASTSTVDIEFRKNAPSTKAHKLSSSSSASSASNEWDEFCSEPIVCGSTKSFSSITSAGLVALRHKMSNEDVLNDKIRVLQQENERLKRDLDFCREFDDVKTWIAELIAMKKSMTASPCIVCSVHTTSEAHRVKSSQKNIESRATSICSGDLVAQPYTPIDATVFKEMGSPTMTSNETVTFSGITEFEDSHATRPARFPITQDVIDLIPAKSKKTDSHFVASLLRLMYSEEYLATHTMGANLTGKESMDEKELAQIIDATVLQFRYPKAEKEAKVAFLRKVITATLNNTKQKLKKKMNTSMKQV